MTPVRVAAVGVGGWGRVLADATRQGTGLAIVACTSRSADNRAAFAKAYGCRIHPSFEAVLADPHVIDDATSILFEFASGSLGYLGTSWVHANRTAVITVHGTEAQAWSEADGTRPLAAPPGQADGLPGPRGARRTKTRTGKWSIPRSACPTATSASGWTRAAPAGRPVSSTSGRPGRRRISTTASSGRPGSRGAPARSG